MDYPEASDSPLAWSWVIEALATSREVELDLICDLVETTPKLYDHLSEAAREMIALRNLEALYDPAKVLNNGVSPDQEEIQFDSSECFSRVLQRVMDQPSVSSLRKDGSDPLPNARKGSDKLMREVHAFVERRKASMPKCALQELSDILQNGDACHETNLMRERNCLQNKKRMQDCPIDVQSAESPPEKKLRHDNNGPIASTEQNSAPLTSSELQDCPVDAQSGKSLLRKKPRPDCNGSTASTEKNSASPLISSDMQDISVDGQSGKSPPGRKLSQDSNGSIASTEQNSDPLTSSDNIQPYPLSWKPAQSIGLLTWYPCDVSSKAEKMNAKNSSTPTDSSELELDICIKCNEGGEVLICSVNSCPTVVHEGCLGFSVSIDNRDDFLCPFCVCSSAKSEYAEAKEKMLLAREKLSLFVGGNPDYQSKGFTNVNANPPKQGVDVRTFKGKGVHRVDRASTDKQHEGHGAQNNVPTSAPNCSSKVGEEGITAKSSRLERRFIIVNANPPRQGRDERTFKGKGVYQVDGASTDKQREGHVARDNVHTSPSNCSSKEGEDIPAKNCQLEEDYTDVNANPPGQGRDERPFKGKGVYQAHQALADQQQKGHLVRNNVHTLPPNCSSKQGKDITEKNCQFEKGKQTMPIEHFHYAGVRGGIYELRSRKQFDNPSKNASCASSGKLKGTSETKNHTTNPSDNCLSPPSRQKLADKIQGASSTSLDDCDGISQEETCRVTPLKPSQRVTGAYSARYLDRRIRVPWTEEEVEMLKEGMKRYGSKDVKVIPWTTILEFGSKVFWKGRIGGDLKDKWRNLMKANPDLR